jgi:signal transduction histidine kinase
MDPRPLTLLLVDDNPVNLQVLSNALLDLPYKQLIAPNGTKGLRIAQKALPNLILLDVNMPDMSGFEVCEILKASEETRHIPIIFVSALDDLQSKLTGLRLGGADFIHKPFHKEEIVLRVSNQMRVIEHQREVEHLWRQAQHANTQLLAQETMLEEKIQELETARIALENSQRELEDINHRLEDMVETRTTELKRALLELQQKTTMLVDAERMGTLGQLARTLAHELNSPLGAINASADSVHQAVTTLGENLATYATALRSLPPELHADFLRQPAIIPKYRTHGEKREARKHLINMLIANGLDNADERAGTLVEFGEPAFWTQHGSFLATTQGGYVLELLSNLNLIYAANQNVAQSSFRAKKLVDTLSVYAQSARASKEMIDVAASLEQSLKLMSEKLSFKVALDYRAEPNLPHVFAPPAELNKVWVALITNALQAMEYKGKLLIRAYAHDGCINVQITDDGPGIPEGLIDQIFQPFFTTRQGADNLGLGLDMCLRIIDHLGGVLGVRSQYGETTFTVRLPIPQHEGENPSYETATSH